MVPSPVDDADEIMPRPQRISVRLLQAALLAWAAYKLFRIARHDSGVIAVAWSIPWIILAVVATLLIPTLFRLGWRRFGRPAPIWTIAAIVSLSVWAVATVICWMALSTVLILSD